MIAFRKLIILFCSLFLFICVANLSAQQQITKKRGKVRLYFPEGQLHSKGKVKNYKRRGEWKYYNRTGEVVAVANFVNDTINGAYNEYYADGTDFIKGTYCMNVKCGNWKTYAPDATLISDENFEKGQMHGDQFFMYPSGKLREKIVAEHGVILSRMAWYSNGRLKLTETYRNGLQHGRWVTYSEFDSIPVTIDEYDNGRRHGWHYAYHSAQMVEKFHYQNGLADGESWRWDNDGRIAMREYYTHGQIDSGFYYRNGIILRSSHFTGEVKHGAEVDFDRAGDTLKISWWNKGELDSSITYHPNGRRSSLTTYNNAVNPVVASYTGWDTAGHLLQTGMFVRDMRDGEWFSYYPDGKKRSRTTYSKGQMLGLYTKWYPNGKKMIEMNFLPAGVNTPPDAWNEKGKLLQMGSREYTEIVEGNRPGEIYIDGSMHNRPIIERRVEELQKPLNDPAPTHGPGSDPTMYDYEGPVNTIDPEAEQYHKPDSSEVMLICDVMPEFPGGTVAMRQFVTDNLVDPRAADDHREGTVYVEYIVERDGSISGIKVVKGIANSPDLNQAAMDVVAKFPKHSPGSINGRLVRCRYVVPVKFLSK